MASVTEPAPTELSRPRPSGLRHSLGVLAGSRWDHLDEPAMRALALTEQRRRWVGAIASDSSLQRQRTSATATHQSSGSSPTRAAVDDRIRPNPSARSAGAAPPGQRSCEGHDAYARRFSAQRRVGPAYGDLEAPRDGPFVAEAIARQEASGE
jgi:hypothetical protein